MVSLQLIACLQEDFLGLGAAVSDVQKIKRRAVEVKSRHRKVFFQFLFRLLSHGILTRSDAESYLASQIWSTSAPACKSLASRHGALQSEKDLELIER